MLLDAGAPLEHQRPGDWGGALHWAVGYGDRAAVQRQAAYAALAMVRARCGGRLPARLPSDCG